MTLGVTLDLDSYRVFSSARFETYVSYYKVISIAATDYYNYFYLIKLSLFDTYISKINRSINKFTAL